jgi:hypothetical protein
LDNFLLPLHSHHGKELQHQVWLDFSQCVVKLSRLCSCVDAAKASQLAQCILYSCTCGWSSIFVATKIRSWVGRVYNYLFVCIHALQHILQGFHARTVVHTPCPYNSGRSLWLSYRCKSTSVRLLAVMSGAMAVFPGPCLWGKRPQVLANERHHAVRQASGCKLCFGVHQMLAEHID